MKGAVLSNLVSDVPPDAGFVRWQPDQAARGVSWPVPTMPVALGRGLLCRCPACGQTKLFQGYLRVVAQCAECTAPLGLARADDAPPYFTILIVGHLIVPLMFVVERDYHPALWLQSVVWLPLIALLSVLLLRPIKGATVGLMLKLGMLKAGLDE
jgi:uncharacterized protein (DUF983 family)